MTAKAISEYQGKSILQANLITWRSAFNETLQLSFQESNTEDEIRHRLSDFESSESTKQFLSLHSKLVVKLDQLIKRRGKNELIKLGVNWDEAKQWIIDMSGKTLQIGTVIGKPTKFLIEPYVAHRSEEEHYLCIQSNKNGDEILFCIQGGIDVGDVDTKASKLFVPIGNSCTPSTVMESLRVPTPQIASFVCEVFNFYCKLNFTFLEINPFVQLLNGRILCLDLAAKLDSCAEFDCKNEWNISEWMDQFGKTTSEYEKQISKLDAKTGASLKFVLINPKGRIWTMVAGGGASVAYFDAIVSLGLFNELANYGEYSGAPTEQQTYEYASIILSAMLHTDVEDHSESLQFSQKLEEKILIVGGGIANFTNIAATFSGISKALREKKNELLRSRVSIFIRRGGPNYQKGLQLMEQLGKELGISVLVYGPETHITSQLKSALQPFIKEKLPCNEIDVFQVQQKLSLLKSSFTENQSTLKGENIFSQSKCIIYGIQTEAIQSMLDFDYLCGKKEPSVVAIISPFKSSMQFFYWGTEQIQIPIFCSIYDSKFPDVNCAINFASSRSAYESCMIILNNLPALKMLIVVAEGIPERQTRLLIKRTAELNVMLIGPATVGGIRAGSFKIGHSAGLSENIISCKLYREGSVSYVTKSGGLSNELNSMIATFADGLCEGIALGGDRYSGSSFQEHLLRFQADPQCKIIIILGEVGGLEEYNICDLLQSGKVTKPIIAWCIGTGADKLKNDIQFGHAGAFANSSMETAKSKNESLQKAGAFVPPSFELLPQLLSTIYNYLLNELIITPIIEPKSLPNIPLDYKLALSRGIVRKTPQIYSSISDDRGEDVKYAGIPISTLLSKFDISSTAVNSNDSSLQLEMPLKESTIGSILSLLWFKRSLPPSITNFIEMILVLIADHGPAVSGAHNTIVSSRAGKDLISSLCSGLLTIGDRFGGALSGSAIQFFSAIDMKLSPSEFVHQMKQKGKHIMGIGHRIKSISNPDSRVSMAKRYIQRHFPNCPTLTFALEVEKITTSKKDSLILNIDGVIAVSFVDIFRHSGCFTKEEADFYINNDTLNGLFVVARSIGLVGHYIDQKRLEQPLYRQPWEDICYLL